MSTLFAEGEDEGSPLFSSEGASEGVSVLSAKGTSVGLSVSSVREGLVEGSVVGDAVDEVADGCLLGVGVLVLFNEGEADGFSVNKS